MTLNEAIRILIERAEINRAMCPVAKSDFDRFCRDEADATDLVVKELKNGTQKAEKKSKTKSANIKPDPKD